MARKEGKHYEFDDLEFWAENGLIYIEDHRDDSFKADLVAAFLKRAAVLSVEARRMSGLIKSSHNRNANGVLMDDRKKLLDCIECMVAAAKEAKLQGDPTDPKVIEDLRKQRKKNILLPGANPTRGGNKRILLGNGRFADTVSGKKIIETF